MAKYAKQTEADGWQLPVCAGSLLEHSMWWGKQPHRRLQSSQGPAKLLSGGPLSRAHCPHPAKNQSTLMLILPAPPKPVPTCVDWAASIEHCNWGFITKRIDKKHQPSVNAMMCIFDGIRTALQSHFLVCMQLHLKSCAHWQIELSLSSLGFLKIGRMALLIAIVYGQLIASW